MLIKKTINAILEYIEENLESRLISIEMLVSYSGYSRRYLQLIFQRYTGVPLGRYIQLRRVTRASVYLHLTKLPLAAIAERLRYDSQQTFNREFKKFTGCTPKQYRDNKIWEFEKQTGSRFVDMFPPEPEVRFRPPTTAQGNSFTYRQKIPGAEILSSYRWGKIKSLLEIQESINLSNKVHPSDDHNEVIIDTFIWDDNEHNCSKIDIAAGAFAYFTFTGTIKEYAQYIHNIYMNTLPFYKLKKRDDYDIEIISKKDDSTFCIEYYLPVNICPPEIAPHLRCLPLL